MQTKKIIMVIVLTISAVFTSCQKDIEPVETPQLVRYLFLNKAADNAVMGVKIDGEVVDTAFRRGLYINRIATAGDHLVTLFDVATGQSVLDTNLSFIKGKDLYYEFFRTGPDEPMVIVAPAKEDTVSAPPDGYIKFSFANFTRHLPGNLEVAFIPINVNTGEFGDTVAVVPDPGKTFSKYIQLPLLPDATSSTGFQAPVYQLVLRDAVSKVEITQMTDPITGEPIEWGWYIIFESSLFEFRGGTYPARKVFTGYLYSYAEEWTPTQFQTSVSAW